MEGLEEWKEFGSAKIYESFSMKDDRKVICGMSSVFGNYSLDFYINLSFSR